MQRVSGDAATVCVTCGHLHPADQSCDDARLTRIERAIATYWFQRNWLDKHKRQPPG